MEMSVYNEWLSQSVTHEVQGKDGEADLLYADSILQIFSYCQSLCFFMLLPDLSPLLVSTLKDVGIEMSMINYTIRSQNV